MASTGRRVGSLTRALRQNREAGSLLRPNRDVHHVTRFLGKVRPRTAGDSNDTPQATQDKAVDR